MQLTSSQLQEFQHRGFVFLPSLLPAGLVEELQATLPELLHLFLPTSRTYYH